MSIAAGGLGIPENFLHRITPLIRGIIIAVHPLSVMYRYRYMGVLNFPFSNRIVLLNTDANSGEAMSTCVLIQFDTPSIAVLRIAIIFSAHIVLLRPYFPIRDTFKFFDVTLGYTWLNSVRGNCRRPRRCDTRFMWTVIWP